jgi:tRNA threonylcarbamoyladenosine biosynthesis protein TsaB
MIHLAIETAGKVGSLALFEAMRPLATVALPPAPRMAASLAPAIEQLLAAGNTAPGSVGLVSVTHGPGSFTGIRIGVATAKALALAWQVPAFGADTLHVIGSQIAQQWTATPRAGNSVRVEVGIPAYRQLVYAASFRAKAVDVGDEEIGFELEPLGPSDSVPRITWYQRLSAAAAEVPLLVGGAAAIDLPDDLAALRPTVPLETWQPMASTVARLAWQAAQAGQLVSAAELVPVYLRPSAAEEQQAARSQDT